MVLITMTMGELVSAYPMSEPASTTLCCSPLARAGVLLSGSVTVSAGLLQSPALCFTQTCTAALGSLLRLDIAMALTLCSCKEHC